MPSIRVRYNLCSSTLSANLGSNAGTDTTIQLNAPFKEGGSGGTNIPTLGLDEILVLRIGNEIMHLTSYTSGATTGTILRAQDGTSVAAHTTGATVRNIPTASDLSTPVDDNIWYPRTNNRAGTDEFNDRTIDPAWVRVDRTGTAADLTYTEDSGVMSLRHNGYDPASDFHALLRPIVGLSPPITIESCVRYTGPMLWNNLMNGLVFSDNATYGSGKQIGTLGYSNSGNYSGIYVTNYLGTNWTSIPTTPAFYGQAATPGGRYYFRLQWVSSNTWSSWWSGDGVSWIPMMVNYAYTMSPSHFGLYHSHWTGTAHTISTWEYFRVI